MIRRFRCRRLHVFGGFLLSYSLLVVLLSYWQLKKLSHTDGYELCSDGPYEDGRSSVKCWFGHADVYNVNPTPMCRVQNLYVTMRPERVKPPSADDASGGVLYDTSEMVEYTVMCKKWLLPWFLPGLYAYPHPIRFRVVWFFYRLPKAFVEVFRKALFQCKESAYNMSHQLFWDYLPLFRTLNIFNLWPPPKDLAVVATDEFPVWPPFDEIHKALDLPPPVFLLDYVGFNKSFENRVVQHGQRQMVMHQRNEMPPVPPGLPVSLLFREAYLQSHLRLSPVHVFESIDTRPPDMVRAAQQRTQAFRDHILARFGLDKVPYPTEPRVLLQVRNHTRAFLNVHELTSVLDRRKVPYTLAQFEKIGTFREQVELFRNHTIFIGIHGAAYAHTLWMQPPGVVVEMFPNVGSRKVDYYNLARVMEVNHIHWINPHPERQCGVGCDPKFTPRHAPQDAHFSVDPREFEELLDRCLRLFASKGPARYYAFEGETAINSAQVPD
eukprot:TRINITY_DN27893_c0_g1_i1.p1 TRINITY_DN27893_c0_g1~~TRINITY_DN27893_c0_g1_i1.p1  ORF type:complete len:495 (+),score=120.47 TRINITY_DN27893_c0_g1_i1:81-1565(+)